MTQALGLRTRRPLGFQQPIALADVPRDLGCADDTPRAVAHGRDGERYADLLAAARDARRLIVLDALATSEPSDDLGLLAVQLARNERQNRFADDLLRGVPEEAFRGRVPRRDDAVERLADDRVIG